MLWPHLAAITGLTHEPKRGSTERLILALVEDRPRHGTEIARLVVALDHVAHLRQA
jgi:hypothetical protein